MDIEVMQNQPYDFTSDFYDFCFMPKFDENIEYLNGLAEPEDWEYKNSPSNYQHPILRNYIKYTYQRVAEEKKISVTADEEFCCWNTGLITERQEPIFMLLEKNKLSNSKPYWHFWKFCRKGEWELNKFPSIPEMAHYFDDPAVLVFDPRKELRVNVEHIISDNKSRFPLSLQNMHDFGLQNIVKGAIDSAKERAKRNYKTAIPQYYQSNIQLLLPLNLLDPRKSDLALVVERVTDFYRGSTCLTLDMAYNNARQLARPDRDWLIP
jgi:hypothetical protein